MTVRRFAGLIAVVGMAVMGASDSAATERFVSVKHGNDTNDGVSWRKPWKTLGRAFQNIKSGTTITLAPGIYREAVRGVLRGTKDAPITVRAQFTGSAVISGFISVTGFRLVEDKRFTYVADVAEKIPEPAIALEPDTCTRLRETPEPDIVEERLGSFYVDREAGKVYVHRSDSAAPGARGIQLSVAQIGIGLSEGKIGTEAVGPTFVTIEGLEVCGFSTYGMRLDGGRDVTIRDCSVHDCNYGIYLAHTSYRTRILSCDVFRNWGANMETANIQITGGAVDCLVRDCLVHDTEGHGLRTYGGIRGAEESWPGTVFERNIVWNVQAFNIMYKGGNSKTSTARRNVYFGAFSGVRVSRFNTGFSGPVTSGDRAGDLYLGGEERGAIRDPKFVDPLNRDYRLQSDSPARGKGPDGTDLGAYQYAGDVFFVRPDGNDAAAGTCVTGAWKTLAHAAKSAKPGQTVLVMAGTYSEPLAPAASGKPDAPIIFRARGHDRVVIDRAGIDLRGRCFIRVEGFIVQGNKGTGIVAGGPGTEGVEITMCVAWHNDDDGIRIEGPIKSASVFRCTSVANRNAGIRVSARNERVTLTDNILDGNGVQMDIESPDNTDMYIDRNNYFLANDRIEMIGSLAGKTAAGLENWRELTDMDDRSFTGEPAFLDGAGGDFRISRTSPCSGAGMGSYSVGACDPDPSMPLPTVTDLRVSGITSTTATVIWWTRMREGNARVDFGPTRQLGHEKFHPTEQSAFHHVALTGLKPDTTYYYRATTQSPAWLVVTAESGRYRQQAAEKRDTATSDVREFRTLAADLARKTWYVSGAQGKDGDGGRSATTPLRRIRQAAERAVAGDTIVIEPGTYCETIMPLHSGTAERPITFKSSGWLPVDVPGKHIAQSLIHLIGTEHIRFQGFHLHGSAHHGYRGYFGGYGCMGMVWMDKTDDVRFSRCFFDGRGSYVQVALRSAPDPRQATVTVEDCAFLATWSPFKMMRQSAEFNHCVFGITYFGQIWAADHGAQIRIHNSIATSATEEKMPLFGYLVRIQDGPDHIHNDYNGFWWQPYDKAKWIAVFRDDSSDMVLNKAGSTIYVGDGALNRWQADTGNDAHSLEGRPDFATYQGGEKWNPGDPLFGSCEDPKTPRKVMWPDDFRLGPKSDFRNKGDDGLDLGIRFPD